MKNREKKGWMAYIAGILIMIVVYLIFPELGPIKCFAIGMASILLIDIIFVFYSKVKGE